MVKLGAGACFPGVLFANVQRRGYRLPSPAQEYVIPFGLAGRDVLCRAPASSGQTTAFLITVIGRMMAFSRPADGGHVGHNFAGPRQPDVLILAHPRERCQQIYEEALIFCDGVKHTCAAMYSADSIRGQTREFANGIDLLVTTGSCLLPVLQHKIIDLQGVASLVLDDVARAGDVGSLRRVLDICHEYGLPSSDKRQTLMSIGTDWSEEQAMAAGKLLFDHVGILVAPGAQVRAGGAEDWSQPNFPLCGDSERARLYRISRAMSGMLRHRSRSGGRLPVRADGYCPMDALCARLGQLTCTEEDIVHVVRYDAKLRFETKVRLQGKGDGTLRF